MSLPHFVLDSFALLAWLQDERGAQTVTDLLDRARHREIHLALSLINLGEVLYIVEREESTPAAHRVLAYIDALPITQVEAGRQEVLAAAHFKAKYRMSYADCFALALATDLGAAVVTGDPEFKTQTEVELVWIGP